MGGLASDWKCSMPANHVLSVRLPLDVFERLAALAAREHRSINAQLVHIITEATKETTK